MNTLINSITPASDEQQLEDARHREHKISKREVAADTREYLANLRETTADTRENTADTRELHADSRETTADTRETKADTRESTADSRESTANTRETKADTRESTADSRETTADTRENTADTRELHADSRETTANTRETKADTRETTADSRESTADTRENTADTRELHADSRETTANTRETKANTRESTADLRDLAADNREQQIYTVEARQIASDDHMHMLQLVNERMIIATLEAQRLAEEIQIAKSELQISQASAEKANLAKSDFLSSMSHELRSPLNAILGFAQLLETGMPPPTPAQAIRLQQITKAGWYLFELINEILDLAVIESGKLSLSREPVSLVEVMHECQSMIESQAQQHDIRISFLPFDPTWFANADRTRVKQVLINLLSNAIKYNNDHGSVEIACTAISKERIRISVKDTGPGLPPQKLQHLFEPFNRLGQEGGEEEGTGIGLVVTKKLVELMDGTINVESTVGLGSTFWIELIRVDMPQLSRDNIAQEEPVQKILNDEPVRTLLYVEDNPANLMLVEQIIEDQSHLHMLSARDASHGILLARAHLPDIILMDINLPGISGVEALAILRSDPATENIPVIALSANAMVHDIEKGLEAGFFRYITKPIKIIKLLNAINEALKYANDGLSNAEQTGTIL